MRVIDPGNVYELDNGVILMFPHTKYGRFISDNTTTTCEQIEVMIHRIVHLNGINKSHENDATIAYLKMALKNQKSRKQRQSSGEDEAPAKSTVVGDLAEGWRP